MTSLQETNEEVQLVQAFLLNDCLMIASHIRRRKGPVRYKFQALYELDNMAIVEIKDSDAVRNTFKILMFPDSHLYQVHMYSMYNNVHMYNYGYPPKTAPDLVRSSYALFTYMYVEIQAYSAKLGIFELP